MHAPQITIAILYAMSFTVTAVKHGQPREGHHNVGNSIASLALVVGILWWGGWWTQ